ncbi:MAG TPA: SPOR domain-containing protein [candidate division Zixibacteria bacterium]|nr:SPOR domain-containing protein [candidate division Zixibacteria bacterium]
MGCSKSVEYGEETKTTQVSNTSSTTRLDPIDLPQDSRVIPKLQPHKGDITGTGKEPDVVKDTAKEEASTPIKPVQPQLDTLASQALRIQLHSTELFGEAKKERIIAEEIFDQPVYLDYEVPYYKVRVGSFSDRKDAENYLSKAKTAGYQNAWIVAVRVNVKEAQPLYENLPVPKAESSKGK